MDTCKSPVAVLPAGINPAQSTQAWTVWLVQSQLNQYFTCTLFRFKGPFGAHWEDISAGAILVIVPSLVIFLLLQRFIYNGLTRGAVK